MMEAIQAHVHLADGVMTFSSTDYGFFEAFETGRIFCAVSDCNVHKDPLLFPVVLRPLLTPFPEVRDMCRALKYSCATPKQIATWIKSNADHSLDLIEEACCRELLGQSLRDWMVSIPVSWKPPSELFEHPVPLQNREEFLAWLDRNDIFSWTQHTCDAGVLERIGGPAVKAPDWPSDCIWAGSAVVAACNAWIDPGTVRDLNVFVRTEAGLERLARFLESLGYAVVLPVHGPEAGELCGDSKQELIAVFDHVNCIHAATHPNAGDPRALVRCFDFFYTECYVFPGQDQAHVSAAALFDWRTKTARGGRNGPFWPMRVCKTVAKGFRFEPSGSIWSQQPFSYWEHTFFYGLIWPSDVLSAVGSSPDESYIAMPWMTLEPGAHWACLSHANSAHAAFEQLGLKRRGHFAGPKRNMVLFEEDIHWRHLAKSAKGMGLFKIKVRAHVRPHSRRWRLTFFELSAVRFSRPCDLCEMGL